MPSYDELLERLDALESRALTLKDLPIAALQRRLEADWQPNAGLVVPSLVGDVAAVLSAPRKIMQWDGAHGAGVAAGSLIVQTNFATTTPTANAARPPSWWTYVSSEWAIPGYQTEFGLVVRTGRNAVSPGGNWIWAPWRVTSVGGAGAVGGITYAMAGSFSSLQTVLTPYTQGKFAPDDALGSGWMTAADAGWNNGETFAMGVNTSAATAANSYTNYSVDLLARWVKETT